VYTQDPKLGVVGGKANTISGVANCFKYLMLFGDGKPDWYAAWYSVEFFLGSR